MQKFGKSKHDNSAFLTQTDQRTVPRMDNPSSFVTFASFPRRYVQTFPLHYFDCDLKVSAIVKVDKDKLKKPMTNCWNEHVRSTTSELLNLAYLQIG